MQRIDREPYRGWEAWRMRRGAIELVVVPQIGGRVMNVVWRGRELFFVHPELAGRVEDVALLDEVPRRKRELGFLLWGGEKTWLAPQSRWDDALPSLDLDSGAYAVDIVRGRVVLTSPVDRETGIQIVRTVEWLPDAEGWTLTHRLTNRASTTEQWAPWGVSMVVRPGRVYLPTNPRSPFPEGVKTFVGQPGSDESRERVVRIDDGIATIDCTGPGAFKYGVDPGEGWMLGVVELEEGHVGIHKSVDAVPGRPYGHDCIAEVYDSDRWPYFEMEMHGPLTSLSPGQSVVLQETTRLVPLEGFPTGPDDIRRIVRG